jgi:hypothetical protein
MPGKFSSLNRRLAKVEQKVADRVSREELANCICCEMTVLLPEDAKEFEGEMNRTCPVHGFRRFGHILPVVCVNMDKTPHDVSAKLLRVLETYKLRLSQLSGYKVELEEDDSQET